VEILARRYVELEKLTRQSAAQPILFPSGVKIPTGHAPAAGFESYSGGKSQVSPATEGPAFLQKIAAAREEGQALFELTQHIGNSLSLDDTFSVLSVRLKKMVPFDALAVYLQRGNELVPEYVTGENARLFSSLRIPMGHGLAGWVAETGKSIVNGNPSVEPGYLNDPSKFSTLRSALAVPLEGINGIVGVLSLYHCEGDAYCKDHLRILQAISSKLSLAVENSLRYRQAESSATTDFLTELPNARSLYLQLDAELARCAVSKQPVALLVCDLDGFKEVNDRYGHLEGNRLLKVVASTLRSNCRSSDYVARMGGDEFVLILPGLQNEVLEQRIHHLQRVCAEEIRMQTGLDVTISIGAAWYPQDGENAEEVLTAADRSMYKVKNSRHQRRKAGSSSILLARPTAVNE
jgi:diguanylate cyclase (GGDEF)-like protein